MPELTIRMLDPQEPRPDTAAVEGLTAGLWGKLLTPEAPGYEAVRTVWSTTIDRCWDLIRLTALMERTRGKPEIISGLIDSPVVWDHPDLAVNHLHELSGKLNGACIQTDSAACRHGTFVAGILSAKRGSPAPAICLGFILLVRPIFSEATPANGDMPSAKPEDLADAILDCIQAGTRVLNLSAAIT